MTLAEGYAALDRICRAARKGRVDEHERRYTLLRLKRFRVDEMKRRIGHDRRHARRSGTQARRSGRECRARKPARQRFRYRPAGLSVFSALHRSHGAKICAPRSRKSSASRRCQLDLTNAFPGSEKPGIRHRAAGQAPGRNRGAPRAIAPGRNGDGPPSAQTRAAPGLSRPGPAWFAAPPRDGCAWHILRRIRAGLVMSISERISPVARTPDLAWFFLSEALVAAARLGRHGRPHANETFPMRACCWRLRILVMLLGGISLLGYHTRPGALMLFAFTIVVSALITTIGESPMRSTATPILFSTSSSAIWRSPAGCCFWSGWVPGLRARQPSQGTSAGARIAQSYFALKTHTLFVTAGLDPGRPSIKIK